MGNFNIDANSLFFSLLFSLIGIGFYAYGKRNNVYFRLSGFALMVYPYFVSNLAWMIIIGIILIILPFIVVWFS